MGRGRFAIFKGVLKLLVFDLDGTLADTREDLWRSANHALEQAGLQPLGLEAVMNLVGNGAKVLIRSCISESRGLSGPSAPPASEAMTDAVLASFLDHYREHCLEKTRAYPGVATSLARLGRYRKAVLTNKPTQPAVRILEGLGLAGHFDIILGGDNPHGRKPDPAALNHLISALEAAPGSTVMVGDGIQDALAARRAGVSLIGFLNGIAPRAELLAESPDATVETMAGLPEAVAELEARLMAESTR